VKNARQAQVQFIYIYILYPHPPLLAKAVLETIIPGSGRSRSSTFIIELFIPRPSQVESPLLLRAAWTKKPADRKINRRENHRIAYVNDIRPMFFLWSRNWNWFASWYPAY